MGSSLRPFCEREVLIDGWDVVGGVKKEELRRRNGRKDSGLCIQPNWIPAARLTDCLSSRHTVSVPTRREAKEKSIIKIQGY